MSSINLELVGAQTHHSLSTHALRQVHLPVGPQRDVLRITWSLPNARNQAEANPRSVLSITSEFSLERAIFEHGTYHKRKNRR